MKTISKTLLIAMTLFIVNGSSVFAKSGDGGTLFGIEAGVNFANVGDVPAGFPSTSMLVGFRGGIFADMNIGNNLYFQPEVAYSAVGADLSESGQTGTLNLGYIQVPLNFSYRLASGLNFNVDPYIAFNLSAKVTEGGTTEDLKNPPAGETSNVNSVDYGVGVGVGYLLSSGLGFKAVYSIGLGDVEKSQAATTFSDAQSASITNNAICVTVLYEMGKK